MEQDTQWLIDTLYQVVKGNITHKDYDRVTHLRRLYTSLITGEDMDWLMRRFDLHESAEAFKQRKDITNHITSSVSNNLMKPLYKVPRSNSAKRFIGYDEDNDNKKKKELEAKLGLFWENTSLDNWFSNKWIDINGTDPNAWCVFEWKDYDNTKEKATPYPFMASADEVIYFNKDNAGDLQFLVIKTSETDQFGLNPRNVYTIYGKDETVVFKQVLKDEMDDATKNKIQISRVKEGEVIEISINSIPTMGIVNGSNLFTIGTYEHKLNAVPAFCVGFKRDKYTDGRTFVSVIDDAVPILMKMVKANSEMDLTAALHVFPQKVQYANRCTATGCNMGHLPDGSTCPTCGGTGYQTSKTAQDVIILPMPRDKEEFLNLDNMVKYISPSVELVAWQDRYIDNLTIRCKEAMYNTELFSKKEVAETATGKNIDLQNVYDSLYDMAMSFSIKWKFSVTTIAKIIDQSEGLTCYYVFSKDFKLKSLTDLYNDLTIVGNSNADNFIKEAIYDDIAGIFYGEDTIAMNRYKTQKAFYPFSGMSEKEIILALNSPEVTEYAKTLYLNSGWIYDELYMESLQKAGSISFYELSREEQKKLIDQKVSEIIVSTQKEVDINQLA